LCYTDFKPAERVFRLENARRDEIFYAFRSFMPTREVITTSPAATQALGRRLGRVLEPGSVIALVGELGSGKTLLTRGICEGLGVPLRQVNSPTFVLVNEYCGRLPVFHLDVYRLGGAADVVELGITDYFQRAGQGVMIVEWAEKLPGVLPEDRLEVSIERLSARKRRFSLAAEGPHFSPLFKELAAA
jgi:tRNA threonylcarbamoyladenosine biosynthesis protein TsaE